MTDRLCRRRLTQAGYRHPTIPAILHLDDGLLLVARPSPVVYKDSNAGHILVRIGAWILTA